MSLLKFSLRSSIPSLMSFSIFISIILNFAPGILVASISFHSFGGCLLFFHLGHISLSPHFLFVYYVDLLLLPKL